MHCSFLVLPCRNRWRVFLLGAVLSAVGAQARADPIEWGDSWQLRLNGQQLSVQPFSSSLTPDALMRELAGRFSELRRFLVGDGRVLLSGIREGEHLLAEIQAGVRGTQGYVSALRFGDSDTSGPGSLAPGKADTGIPYAGGRSHIAGRNAVSGQGPERIFDWTAKPGLGPERIFDFGPAGELRLTSHSLLMNEADSAVAKGEFVIAPSQEGGMGVVLNFTEQ